MSSHTQYTFGDSSTVDPNWRPAYHGGTLPGELPPTPWTIAGEWMRQARENARDGDPEPNAVALATADAHGLPDVRIVLVKEATPAGLVIYTDSGSAKAAQLEANPQAAMTLFWARSSRQLRLRGRVERVADDVAAEYFSMRPRGSQIAAVASNQSTPIDSRAALVEKFEQKDAEHGERVPAPPHWVGYRLVPCQVEVWAGDSDRLHDRARYTADVPTSMDQQDAWRVTRLQP